MRLKLCVHRFRCPNPSWPRRTFVERPPELMPIYARCTQRLMARLLAAVNTETGHLPPRMVGIDDWAFKKGLRYGMIVIDLERMLRYTAL